MAIKMEIKNDRENQFLAGLLPLLPFVRGDGLALPGLLGLVSKKGLLAGGSAQTF